jgi:pyridoxal phosphate enzyme (YggS family)
VLSEKSLLIHDKLLKVEQRISEAAISVGRNPVDIKLVVVTKGHSLDVMEAAIEAGAQRLGENYVEEGLEKILSVEDQKKVEWHMIGHIQSRKAAQVCQYFDYVHSLDSIKLARRLSDFSIEQGRSLPVLLECNTSGEMTKFGFPVWDKDQWGDMVNSLTKILTLSGLRVTGLMTMAPLFSDPHEARPYFKKLKALLFLLKEKFPYAELVELSMGMSSDFEVAIQEGATIVRIGQAILGPRSTQGG